MAMFQTRPGRAHRLAKLEFGKAWDAFYDATGPDIINVLLPEVSWQLHLNERSDD
jgi:hypothetical protein